jgi:hypothetical protein
LLDDADPLVGIYARRFDANGAPVGPDFKVNTHNEYAEEFPTVGALADGGYIVAWAAGDEGGFTPSVFAQRLDAGQLVGPEFLVHADPAGFQSRPAAAGLGDGGFVIVWEDAARDGVDLGIFGQRFDRDAARVGSEFLVNSYTFGQQRRPAVAAGTDGGFVVAFGGVREGSEEVFARTFDRQGEPRGTELQVNTAILGEQGSPSITAEPDGGFLVVWASGGSIGRFNIFARRIGADAAGVGAEFQVNTFTSTMSDRIAPDVASNLGGDVVVVWEAQAQDGGSFNDKTIRGQRYRLIE